MALHPPLFFTGCQSTGTKVDTANFGYDPGCAGAGMTNALWLQEGTPMLQLLPFGWNLTANRIHDGREPSLYKSQQVIRGHLYERMAETANCSHHYWINDNASHAFFQG